MSERLLCSCDGFCGASQQEEKAHVTCRLADVQFEADSSIILEFIALRVKVRGDGPFVS